MYAFGPAHHTRTLSLVTWLYTGKAVVAGKVQMHGQKCRCCDDVHAVCAATTCTQLKSCVWFDRQGSDGRQGPDAMTEVEVVILRFSLSICNPGCLHLVLESVSPKPPYLLENRTGHPFQYRQAGIGEAHTPSHVNLVASIQVPHLQVRQPLV